MSTWTLSLFGPRYGTYPSACSPRQTIWRGRLKQLTLSWYQMPKSKQQARNQQRWAARKQVPQIENPQIFGPSKNVALC
jgi:hypothetical protein